MRTKLKLHLEDLSVDTFDTSPAARSRGTVMGEQCTCFTQCAQNTCPGCPTCDATCGQGTCGATCAGSCYGTCDASCDTCGASCYGSCDAFCTQGWDATCRNIGTCDWADPRYACQATV